MASDEIHLRSPYFICPRLRHGCSKRKKRACATIEVASLTRRKVRPRRGLLIPPPIGNSAVGSSSQEVAVRVGLLAQSAFLNVRSLQAMYQLICGMQHTRSSKCALGASLMRALRVSHQYNRRISSIWISIR